MSRRVSSVGKTLLANTVRSVEQQNRIREEQECWKTRKREERDIKRRGGRSRDAVGESSYERQREENDRRRRMINTPHNSAQEDRWDHGGFNELYPDLRDNKQEDSNAINDLITGTKRKYEDDDSDDSLSSSSRSSTSSSSEEKKKKRKQKRKKHKKEKKSKKKKSKRKKQKDK